MTDEKDELKEEKLDDDPGYDDDFKEDFKKDYETEVGEEEGEKVEYEAEPDTYAAFKLEEDDKPPSQILKLDVGEHIDGRLVKTDTQVNKDSEGKQIESFRYHILPPRAEEPKIIYGTTDLDRWMKPKVVGDRMRIKRLEDSPPKMAGRKPFQNYKVWTIERKKKPVKKEELEE